jgi:hypothetical protein
MTMIRIRPHEAIAEGPIVCRRHREALPKEKTLEGGMINNGHDTLDFSTTGPQLNRMQPSQHFADSVGCRAVEI